MKYYIGIILLLISFNSFAQTYDKPGNYGLQYKRLKADSSLKVPILSDTVRLSSLSGNGDIIYVQSPTGLPDTGFWAIEKGYFTKIINSGSGTGDLVWSDTLTRLATKTNVSTRIPYSDTPYIVTQTYLNSNFFKYNTVPLSTVFFDSHYYFTNGNECIGCGGTDNGFKYNIVGKLSFGRDTTNNDIKGNLNFLNSGVETYIYQNNNLLRSIKIPGATGNNHWEFRNEGGYGIQIINSGSISTYTSIHPDYITFKIPTYVTPNKTIYNSATSRKDININIGDSTTMYEDEPGYNIRLRAGNAGPNNNDKGGNIYLTSGLGGGSGTHGDIIVPRGRIKSYNIPTGNSSVDSPVVWSPSDSIFKKIAPISITAGLTWSDTSILGTKYDIDTINAKIPDISGFIPYSDTTAVIATKYDLDTVNAKIPDISGFLVWSDSNIIATKFDIDTTNLNIPDVSNFVSWTDTSSDIATKHDIDTLNSKIPSLTGYLQFSDTTTYIGTKYDVDSLATSIYSFNYLSTSTAASTYVPLTREIDGIPLSSNIDIQRVWQGKIAGELDTLTTGIRLTFRMPFSCIVDSVKGAVNVASSSGNVVLDLLKNGVSMMSTNKVIIEATETSSRTATTQPILTTTTITDDDIMQIEATSVGTNAISGEFTIYYRRT